MDAHYSLGGVQVRRIKLIALVVVVMLVGLLAVGCSSSAQSDSNGAGDTQPVAEQGGKIEGKWNCIEFKVSGAPVTVPAETPITAEFTADGKLSGNSGVNTYNTTYETDGGGITISNKIVSTMMAGPQDAMDRESSYLTTLPTAVAYQVEKNGQLVLFGPADETIARYTPAE